MKKSGVLLVVLVSFIFVFAFSFVSAHWWCPPSGVATDNVTRPVASYSTSYNPATGNVTLTIQGEMCKGTTFSTFSTAYSTDWRFGNRTEVCNKDFATGECGVGGYEQRRCVWNANDVVKNRWPSVYALRNITGTGVFITTKANGNCASGAMWVITREISVSLSKYNSEVAGNGKGFAMGINTAQGSYGGKTSTIFSYPSEFIALPLAAASGICGNGAIEAGEECDDGNLINGDGCSSVCTTGTPQACPEDQIIMKISSPTNAHGALWNDSAYNSAICSSDVVSRSCIGSSLWLSSITNAHVSTTFSSVYNISVCYGPLICDADSSAGDICSNGGEIVARLSSTTNAHISMASDNAYPVKICCRDGLGAVERHWENMDGDLIIQAEKGDSVRMVYPGGSSGVFEIFEDDTVDNDNIRVGVENISGVIEDGDLVGIWRITQSDFDKGVDIGELNDGYIEAFFNINGASSGNLDISNVSDDSPMELRIISPACGDYFNASAAVSVIVEIIDEDDLVNANLIIDGTVYPFTNGRHTVSHVFNTPGNFQIVLDGSNARGERRRATASIMIINTSVDGEYVAACIDKPEDLSRLPYSSVKFEATNSRGIRFNASSSTYQIIDKDGLNFHWSFSDGRVNPNSQGRLAYNFTKSFESAGNNWAVLEVGII